MASAVVVLAVVGWLCYKGMSHVHSIAIVVNPETLPPNGRAEAIVQLQAANVFGLPAWRKPVVHFQVEQGNGSGRIVEVWPLAVRVRSTGVPGRIVLHVFVQGRPVPYEVVIPVRPNYAGSVPKEGGEVMPQILSKKAWVVVYSQ